jgi:hypothetical protein
MGDLALEHLSADGYTQIQTKAFAEVAVGVTQVTGTPEKVFVQNIGVTDSAAITLSIVQNGLSDGSAMLRMGLDTGSVMPPYGLAYTLSAAGDGGTWGTPQTVYYVLTATNAAGETVASIELSVIIDVETKRVIPTWPQIASATGYKLYRSATAGTYGASSLRTTISGGATLTYTDNGDACSAGTPPVANTTGGAAPAYGTPPTLGTANLTIGVLKAGQFSCYWLNRVIPGGTTSAENPRQAILRFSEA